MAANVASRFAIWLICAVTGGCSSSEPGSLGDYSTERTVVVTGIGTPDSDGCGAPQAPQSDAAALRYRVSSSAGAVKVMDIVGGCALEGRLEDGVVIADGSECSFTANAPLRQLGVISRIYSVFRLDPRSSTVRTRSITQAAVVGGESRSCAVTEERIVGVN